MRKCARQALLFEYWLSHTKRSSDSSSSFTQFSRAPRKPEVGCGSTIVWTSAPNASISRFVARLHRVSVTQTKR